MKRFALLAPMIALAGCRDNGASIQIQAICSATDDCVFADTCDMVALGNPTIAADRTTMLTLPLQLENQLPDNSDKNTYRVNTNDAHIDEVAVEYEGAYTGSAEFGSGGTIYASGTSVVLVDIVPHSIGSQLAGPAWPEYSALLAKLRLRGYYDNGSRFETAEYPVAINVCSGANCAPTCTSGLYCPRPGQWPVACGSAE